MTEPLRFASDYTPGMMELARSACLELATRLGDYSQEIVVVGGLVPSLIIDQEGLPSGVDPHIGTQDLDLGIEVGLLSQQRYEGFCKRLREGGFTPDVNEEGNLTRQRWKADVPGGKITVDFLIPPSDADDRGGKLRDITPDLAAIIIPGLELAFRKPVRLNLSGRTLGGARAEREILVCGPGAFVVLKALAFKQRGREKDAYDLLFVVQYFGKGVEDVAADLEAIRDEPEVKEALEILKSEFLEPDRQGPLKVAVFRTGGPDEVIQADAVGYIRRLLDLVER